MELDSSFVEINDLKWLPWVGKQYFSVEKGKRLFVIGESHYHDGSEKSKQDIDPAELTREIIDDLAIDRNYYGTKIFQNLHRALFRQDNFDAKKLWNCLSFYNFIQRPMETNYGRPTSEDFYKGWGVFFEIFKLLEPDICLFIGTEASNSLIPALQMRTDIVADPIEYGEPISGVYPRKTILSCKGKKTTIIFIRHCSQYFSWDKWNNYLETQISSQLYWLRGEIE